MKKKWIPDVALMAVASLGLFIVSCGRDVDISYGRSTEGEARTIGLMIYDYGGASPYWVAYDDLDPADQEYIHEWRREQGVVEEPERIRRLSDELEAILSGKLDGVMEGGDPCDGFGWKVEAYPAGAESDG